MPPADTNKGLIPGTKFFGPAPFAGMNVQASPIFIADQEFVYVENFLKLGDGNFRTAWDVGTPLYSAPAGKTIVMFYFYTIGESYYAVVFLSDGSAIQVNAVSGATTTIGPATTFYTSSNGDLPATSQWGTQYLLISNKNTNNDYWAWDGSILYAAGTAAPNGVNILSGGINYSTAPTVTPFGGSGTGLTLVPTVNAGSVVQLAITNPGTGYEVGDIVQVKFSGGGSDDSAELVATLAQGVVSAVDITAPGTGYTSDPTVGFTGGGGSGATATATVGGGVSGVSVTTVGAGYSTASVAFSGGGGAGATADATITGGVTAVNVTSGGSGYTGTPTVSFFGGGGTGATATATVVANVVTAITVTNHGTGYTSAPTVTISGGSGTGATATAAVSGVVSAITVTAPGTGYTSAPTVTITGDGSGATATASVTASGVVTVTITDGGSGYTSAPTVTFTGGGGSGASATALVDSTGVSGVTVIDGGSGFTSAPNITFVGGGGIGATGTVLLTPTSVAKVNVTSGGQNYHLTPNATAYGLNGSQYGVTLRPVIANGQVIAVNVLNGGSGITTNMQVYFTPDNLGKSNQDPGTGATAEIVLVPTSISGVQMTSFGRGYTSAPAVEVQAGSNNSAYATVELMPFGISGDAMETFQQRVFILNQTPEPWVVNPPTGNFAVSAPESLTDFATSDGGVLFTNTDRFLQTRYTNVRQSNGYLYMLGDGSVSVISSVTVSAQGTTTFNYQNVDPQTGESWRDSLQDFGRTILFANETGVYGLYGGSVNKISAKLDQLFTDAILPPTGLVPTGAVATLFNIKHYLLLMTIADPDTGEPVNKMITWNERDWVVTSQSVALTYIGSQKVSSKLYAWGTDGAKLYPLFHQPSASLTKRLDTKFYGAPQSLMAKQLDSGYVVAQDQSGQGISMTLQFVASGMAVQAPRFEQSTNTTATALREPTFSAAESAAPYWPVWGGEVGTVPFFHLGCRLTTTSPDWILGNLLLSYQDLENLR